jgi:hypothetical protein
MPKKRNRNKRLDAPHVRLYRWLLESSAYLSLSCPARAVLIEIARGHDGTNNGRLGLSIRRVRTVQYRTRDRSASPSRTSGAQFYRLHDQRRV